MPPKAKFTKEEIINAAFAIVKEHGIEALSARSLGEKLQSSPRPIFTVFSGMEEVRREVVKAAKSEYGKYVARGLMQTPAFKGVGSEYIKFAIEQPKLFRLLFMAETGSSADGVLQVLDENYTEILNSVKNGYSLSDKQAKKLYLNTWIFTHGIAVSCATGLLSLSESEYSAMLTEVFVPLLKDIKGKEL